MAKAKLAALLGFVVSLSIPSCSASSLKAPEFESHKGELTFTAYSGPTVAKKASGNTNPNTVTRENMVKLKEAGFDRLIALYEGGTGLTGADTYETIIKRSEVAEKDALAVLEAMEGLDLKYYVRDWSFYGLVRNYVKNTDPIIDTEEEYEQVIAKMFDENNQYINHPNYGGNFCHDEPYYNELEQIAIQVKLFKKYMALRGKDDASLIVNLYNDTVGMEALNGHSYEEYVDRYFELIAPQLGYVSYDYYPLMSSYYAGSYIKNTYLNNLYIIAKKCKETGIELRTFLQCIGNSTGMRDLAGIGDLRLQIYSEMAFGSRDFIYYEYANTNPQSGTGYGLFDLQNDVYNWTYDAAKTVNNEVHAFEDAYLSYNWDGIMYYNANPDFENIAFTYLEGEAITNHPRVSFKSATQDTIMGTFKNEKGDDAFMLVNFTDAYQNKTSKVTLHFNKARGLLTYRLGQRVLIKLPASRNYTFELYPGEGRFIIPIK